MLLVPLKWANDSLFYVRRYVLSHVLGEGGAAAHEKERHHRDSTVDEESYFVRPDGTLFTRAEEVMTRALACAESRRARGPGRKRRQEAGRRRPRRPRRPANSRGPGHAATRENWSFTSFVWCADWRATSKDTDKWIIIPAE